MNEYRQQQHGLTTTEKAAFVDRVQAEQAEFLHSLRTIHSAAENRMLTRVCTEKLVDRANKLIDMFDDSSIQRGMLK